MIPIRREPDTIDITLAGELRDPPPSPFLAGLMRGALLVAVVAGAIGLAALALWFALLLIPVALVAAAVGWAAWRWHTRGRG